MLRRFHAEEASRPWAPTAVEQEFAFTLERNRVQGRYDLVIEKDGEIAIVDFKTGELRDQKAADKRAKESLQLDIYALAHLKTRGRLPERVELRFLESGLVAGRRPTADEASHTAERIRAAAAAIRRREFPARPTWLACGHCPFREICPHTAWGPDERNPLTPDSQQPLRARARGPGQRAGEARPGGHRPADRAARAPGRRSARRHARLAQQDPAPTRPAGAERPRPAHGRGPSFPVRRQRRSSLETSFAPEPLPIDGDAARLAQVVGNLLQNAAKFTPAGGRVVVSTSAVTVAGTRHAPGRRHRRRHRAGDAPPAVPAVHAGRRDPGPQQGRPGPRAGAREGPGGDARRRGLRAQRRPRQGSGVRGRAAARQDGCRRRRSPRRPATPREPADGC